MLLFRMSQAVFAPTKEAMITHRIMRWLNRARLLSVCMVSSSFLRLLLRDARPFHGPDEVDVIQRDDHQDEIDDLGTGALFTEQVVHVNP